MVTGTTATLVQGLAMVVEQGMVVVTVPPLTQTALDVVLVVTTGRAGRRRWVVVTRAADCVQVQLALTKTMAEVGWGDTCVHTGHGTVMVTVPLAQTVVDEGEAVTMRAGAAVVVGIVTGGVVVVHGRVAVVVVTPPTQLEQGRVSVTVELFQRDCVVVTATDWLTVTSWVVTAPAPGSLPAADEGGGEVVAGAGAEVMESLPAWRRWGRGAASNRPSLSKRAPPPRRWILFWVASAMPSRARNPTAESFIFSSSTSRLSPPLLALEYLIVRREVP
ncbi:hypothetical protein PG989_015771 [Apiospora arundinis]